MEIKGDEKVEKYQVITRDIDDNTYIFVDKGYGQYWKILDKDAVVFYMPDREVYIWH